jgi:hypothetical protein
VRSGNAAASGQFLAVARVADPIEKVVQSHPGLRHLIDGTLGVAKRAHRHVDDTPLGQGFAIAMLRGPNVPSIEMFERER